MSFQSLQDEHPQLSASQLDVLHPAILSCRGVSLVGCLFILWHHYVSARLHSGVSMVQKMVVVISVLDADLAFPKVFGNPLSDTTDVTAACNVQVVTLHVFGLMSVFWNAAIAHCFYRKINNDTDESSVLCERPNVESPDENDFAVDVDYGDEPILLAPIVVACGSPVVVGAPTLVIDDAATVVAGGAPRSAKRIEAEIASFSTTS
ncbi:hypothetical protein GQ600_5599 [Phytophthora cactorum]|nr:hypothetical protein GQ600_5599 [Phytophthora cactorum]